MNRTGFFKSSSSKRLLIRNVRSLVLHLGSISCFLGALYYGVPAVAQSQPSEAATTSETETPVEQPPEPQVPGTISGTVVDVTGAVLVGARIRLTDAAESPFQEAVSGERGEYSFAQVVPGSFRINIAAPGFATQTASGVLHSGEVYLAPPVALPLATFSTEIHVKASRIEIAEEQIKAQEQQRVLGFFPNFYVSYVPDAVPLTSKQKFKLAARTMIDPVTFALSAVGAGIQQSQNDFSGYGQGVEGYAKRFGANYVDNATSTFIGGALLPSLLKQDPRYFYKGTGSVGSRILYAIANSVICKGDNQRWQPNYSAILGGLASGGISNLYYPPKDRGAALVFENTLIGTGETALFNILQEFVLKRFTPHAPKQDPSHP
jgi:hypothetical protein